MGVESISTPAPKFCVIDLPIPNDQLQKTNDPFRLKSVGYRVELCHRSCTAELLTEQRNQSAAVGDRH
jgi:hypothetical protein